MFGVGRPIRRSLFGDIQRWWIMLGRFMINISLTTHFGREGSHRVPSSFIMQMVGDQEAVSFGPSIELMVNGGLLWHKHFHRLVDIQSVSSHI